MPSITDTYPAEADDGSQQIVYSPLTHFFPGVYSPSGFDLMKILFHVATRPNPVINLGPVDASCPIVICDLLLPDTPAVYASDSFLDVTGYTMDEIIGRNCRFLQAPPLLYATAPALPPPPSDSSRASGDAHFISPATSLSSSSSASVTSSEASQPSTSHFSSSSSSSASANNNNDHMCHTRHNPQNGSNTVDPHLHQLLHNAVAENREVQLEITNFRKDGARWENRLSIVPIQWDDDFDLGHAENMLWQMDNMSLQQPRYRYSVGFACDRIAMGM